MNTHVIEKKKSPNAGSNSRPMKHITYRLTTKLYSYWMHLVKLNRLSRHAEWQCNLCACAMCVCSLCLYFCIGVAPPVNMSRYRFLETAWFAFFCGSNGVAMHRCTVVKTADIMEADALECWLFFLRRSVATLSSRNTFCEYIKVKYLLCKVWSVFIFVWIKINLFIFVCC